MQSYAYKINLKSSDFFLHQNSNNQLKTLPKRYLNGAECINLIFIDTFYCISKTNTNAPIMEYMYINLRFKAKSAHVKSKTKCDFKKKKERTNPDKTQGPFSLSEKSISISKTDFVYAWFLMRSNVYVIGNVRT